MNQPITREVTLQVTVQISDMVSEIETADLIREAFQNADGHNLFFGSIKVQVISNRKVKR